MLDDGNPPADSPNRGRPAEQASPDTGIVEDPEVRMRRVLGLSAEPQRQGPNRDIDHQMPRQRSIDPFSMERRKRRFVQDGEVPVVVMNVRRDHGGDTAHAGGPSRLELAEAAAASERVARERAERSLQEARVLVRDLQTKQAHAELASNEALQTREAMRANMAEIQALRESLVRHEERLAVVEAARAALDQSLHAAEAALSAERSARAAAEKTMAEALEARDAAAQRLALRIEPPEPTPTPQPAPRARRATATGTGAKAREAVKPRTAETKAATTTKKTVDREKTARRAKPAAPTPTKATREAKPVRWWLKTSPKPKRPTATLKVPTRR